MPGKIFLATPSGGGTSYPYTPADVAGSTGPLTVLGGTLTGSSTPFLNLSQTWNNAATTFTGALINVTDTASNALSLLQDLQVGGTSKFKVDKTGLITTGVASGSLAFGTSASTGFYVQGSNLAYQSGGNKVWLSAANQFTLIAAARLSWVSGSDPNGAEDVFLYRDAAATLAQRNGTTAQSFRVYNTYTDGSNNEAAVFDWTTTANILSIGTTKVGTGVQRSVNLISGGFVAAQIVGNQFQFVGPIALTKTITAAGTTGNQTISKTTGSVNFAAAATSLVVTNTLCATTSVIQATVATNDTTMKSVAAVAAAGSFTLFPNAVPTAETRVNFVVLN